MRSTVLAICIIAGVLLLAACGGALDDSDSNVPETGGFNAMTAAGEPADGQGTGGDAVNVSGGVSDRDSFGGDGEQNGQQGFLDRKIIRTAELRLTVENVLDGVSDVERIASAAGGFVSESNMMTENPQEEGEEPRRSATVTIRVPSESYQSVMSQLRGVAEEIRSETSNTSEVTEEYTDLQSRLRTLEATENRYLDLLSEAETIDEILTVQDRLDSVRLEIERIQGRLNLLDDLTDLATITVGLEPPPLIAQTSESPKGWAQEAWDSAWETSEEALKVFGTIGIALGVLAIWLAIPGAVALAGWRVFASRRAGGPAS